MAGRDEPDEEQAMTAGARAGGARGIHALRGLSRSLALLAGMAFVTQIGVAVMLPLLPLYATQVGATPFVLGLLTSGHAVASAIGQLAGGFLTERFAARRLVAAGIGVYAGANILIATTTAAIPLIAFRSLAGLGGGVNQIAERLYLTEATDRARRAFANGILSAAGAAGSVLGPAVGGLLVAVSDLRLPFLLVGATSALATLGALFLPRSSVPEGAEVDPAAAGSPAVAVDRDGQAGSRQPIVALFFSNLALMAGFGAFITTYAIFATGNLGWSAAEVGIVWAMFGLGSVLLGPWLARRADLGGRRRMAVLGSIPVVVLPIVMVLGMPRPVIYAVTIVAGGGLTAFESSWYALLAAATDEGRRGRVFGVVTALSNLGVAIGAMGAARAWELVDIRVAVLTCSVTFALAGLAMLAHPPDRVTAPTAAAN
jgi:MFS family permease